MLPTDKIAESDVVSAIFLMALFALSPAMTLCAGLAAGLLTRSVTFGLLVGLGLAVVATLSGLVGWLVFFPALRSYEAFMIPQFVSGAVFAAATLAFTWHRRPKWRLRWGDGGSGTEPA